MFLSIMACLIWVLLALSVHLTIRQTKALEALADETRELRLTSRAKVSTAAVRNQPMSEEQKLVRLGRSSRAKRVVVGGDPDSELHTNLGKSLEEPS